MEEKRCIYVIRNTIDKRIYVGSTAKLAQRFDRHWSSLKLGKHRNKKLQNFYNKYGRAALYVEILEPVEKQEDLISREQFYIDSLKPYFNICPVAGTCLGRKHSEEAKARMSASGKGKVITEEAKKKMSLAKIGKKQSPESVAKSAASRKGMKQDPEVLKRRALNDPNKGKKRSDETKKKLSLSHKGIPWGSKRRKALYPGQIEIDYVGHTQK